MNDGDSAILIANYIRKAEDALTQAEALFGIDQYFGVVNRGYYAMFYAASAILLTKGMGSSKHSGVLSLLDREFVNKGEVPLQWSRMLRNAFNLRSWGDYDTQCDVSEAQARRILDDGRDFLAWAKHWLVEAHFSGS
ncbi:MAG: HEPN domain-containing protein [Nitrospirae bacterium]|nr:HEPN domain-containing protein [Nitrospirota bacterium]